MAKSNINTDTFSDEIFDILCCMCTIQGKNREGKKFCIDCHDYFCLSCVKLHRKVPICLHHKIADIADGQRKYRSSQNKGILTKRCEKHSSVYECKYMDMYCENHDKVGCSICMSDDHSLCLDKFFIQDFLPNNNSEVSPREVRKKLNTLTKTLTEQTEKCRQDKKTLLKRKAEIIDNIERFRQEINDQLDRLQQISVDKVEETFINLENRIDEELNHLKVNKARVSSAGDKLACRNTNQAEVFVNSKIGEHAAFKAVKCIEKSKENYKIEDIDFKVDRKILSQLKEEISLSMITVKNTKTASKSTASKNTKTARTAPVANLQQTCSLLQTKNSFTCRVKTGYDSEYDDCNITGACFMDNGTIVLSDANHEHVKVLDRDNFKVNKHFTMNGEPWQVCPVGMQEVAVTVPTRHKVSVLSIDKHETKYKIKTKFECRGVAFANETLYISDTTSIYVYNVSDKKLEPFSVDEEQELFSVIYSLAVNKDASRIYIADHENGLIVLDNNGKVVGNYNGLKLQGAYHCSVTREGSVLVSGDISNNIVQFTSDGDLVGEILKYGNGSDMIRAVCCNKQMTKLCTSTDFSDYICVYVIC